MTGLFRDVVHPPTISGTMARGGLTSDPTESVSVVSAIVDSNACGGDAMEV